MNHVKTICVKFLNARNESLVPADTDILFIKSASSFLEVEILYVTCVLVLVSVYVSE